MGPSLSNMMKSDSSSFACPLLARNPYGICVSASRMLVLLLLDGRYDSWSKARQTTNPPRQIIYKEASLLQKSLLTFWLQNSGAYKPASDAYGLPDVMSEGKPLSGNAMNDTGCMAVSARPEMWLWVEMGVVRVSVFKETEELMTRLAFFKWVKEC
jgi:hypothetical protein